jgi:hypothetical protein
MKTTLLLAALLATLTATAADKPAAMPAPKRIDPAFAKVEDVVGLPRVLLIGDSISIGYTAPTRELLKGKANVHRIPVNGGPTPNGLKNLKTWLGDSKWDVIHFNWGLHDLKYVGEKGDAIVDAKTPGAHMQVSIGDYEKNLTELVTQLKATGAKLIWCSTTPVPEGAKGRITGDEVKYNEAAARVMKAAGVPTDDLYAHAIKRITEIQNKADVHYNAAGYKYLAEKVAAEIEAALPKK